MQGKKCPKCETKIPWWRQKKEFKCGSCGAGLVMVNHTTFYILMFLVPFLVLPIWIFNPIAMVLAIIAEIWFFAWFIDNKMKYEKITDE